VIAQNIVLNSYRFSRSTGYNSNAGECVHPYYSGDKEIGLEDLIQEQRSLARSKNPFERVIGSLCVASMLKEQLVRLPNSTISQLMTDNIWCQLNLLEPESVIVEIASERLVEKREASLVCPECGSEFWRADE
jgi:uncharacterized protein with PIN domain